MKYLIPSEIMRDSSASYWLKNAMREAIKRDTLDALNDAEALVSMLTYIWKGNFCQVCDKPIDKSMCMRYTEDALPMHPHCS